MLIKNLEENKGMKMIQKISETIVDMLNTEAMVKATVAYGTIISELKEVSRSYKEAKMALDVGKIFYSN